MTVLRPDPFFIGESTALDFLNSVAAPKSVEFEWLESGADLLDWIVRSGLLTEQETTVLRLPDHSQGMDMAAQNVRAFREEFRTFIGRSIDLGKVPTHHPMIDRLNDLMSTGVQTVRLVPGDDDNDRLQLKATHKVQTPDDLLPRIAAACAELIANADFAHVKRCEGAGCTLFFRDVSKNRKRRWCSMDVCGNRAKAAAYRNRS